MAFLRLEDDHSEPSETDTRTEQEKIDDERGVMADEIIRAQNLTNLEDAKRFARNWIMTAAQETANAAFYRGERDKTQYESAAYAAANDEKISEIANLNMRVLTLEHELGSR